jgi:hypothetical protein
MPQLKKRLPYPNKHEKKERDGTFNQALMACKSANLRGKDAQKLHETSIHIYDADHVVLKGPDFEVRGNVSWTRVSFYRAVERRMS